MNKHFNKFSASKKGFTIIELIVVIAIIAVLSGIVLVNVTQYINKSKQAAIQADMRTLPVVAMEYFNKNGNYESFCESDGVNKVNQALVKLKLLGFDCMDFCDNNTKWLYFADLPNDDSKAFCINYKGVFKVISNPSNLTTCECIDS